MARLGLHRLRGVLGKDFFLELGVEARTIRQFDTERVAGNKGFAKDNQMAALRGGLFNLGLYLGERLLAIEPDRRDLSEADGDEILYE